jgi:hypothetical protein
LAIIMENPDQKTDFLSTDTINFRISSNDESINSQIIWRYNSLKYANENNLSTPNQGSTFQFVVNPPALDIPTGVYTGLGRGFSLGYQIQASVDINNQIDYTALIIGQSNLYELLQEYNDFNVTTIPGNEQFNNYLPFGIFTTLLQRGNSNGICIRHEQWIVFDLSLKAEKVNLGYDQDFSRNVPISSGYRCPAGNRRENGASDSPHLRGIAFDWDHGSNTEENSRKNWELAKSIIDHQDYNGVSRIILYDRTKTPAPEYWYDTQGVISIPREYLEKPEDVVFTNGHVDWKYGWE